MHKQYSIQVRHLVILAAGFLLTAMSAGWIISQVVNATDSSAPAKKDNTPVGTVVSWAGPLKSIPKKWLLCDGKLLDNRKYPELFKVIGTSWGGKDTKFNLPDLRGRFLRGVDAGSNRDPDRNKRKASKPGGNKNGLGSVQEDAMQNHAHNSTPHRHTHARSIGGVTFNFNGGSVTLTLAHGEMDYEGGLTSQTEAPVTGPKRYDTKGPLNTSDESRPKNASVHWIIKVK